MNSSNKITEDWNEGEDRRELTAKDLNYYLDKKDTGLHFERMHPFLKDMGLGEKAKNFHLKNVILPAPFASAMGLHYWLMKSSNHKIPFIFCYTGCGGFYLKIPAEYKGDSEAYLKLLADLNYYSIICRKDEKKYSHVISFSDIREHWKRKMSTSAGNLNRLQFSGEMSKIDFCTPEHSDLSGKSLITSLANLFV